MTENLLIPVIVVLLMVAAGTGVRVSQFRLVLSAPVALLGGTAAQVLLLPMVAVALVTLAGPAPELAAGLVLVAASPGGALSNFYCYLGRLNVSLSVMLTTLSTLASFVVLPVVLALSLPAIGGGGGITIPVGEMMVRLLLLLLLPVGLGMLVRHFAPEWVARAGSGLRAVGLVLLVALIALILLDQWQVVRTTYHDAVFLAVLFTLAAVVVGWVVGVVLGLGTGDRYVFAVEFAIRNLGAAALVAVATLGRPEFLAFGAIFVVVQFPLALLLLGLPRLRAVAPTG